MKVKGGKYPKSCTGNAVDSSVSSIDKYAETKGETEAEASQADSQKKPEKK